MKIILNKNQMYLKEDFESGGHQVIEDKDVKATDILTVTCVECKRPLEITIGEYRKRWGKEFRHFQCWRKKGFNRYRSL